MASGQNRAENSQGMTGGASERKRTARTVLVTFVATLVVMGLTVWGLLNGETTHRWLAERLVPPEPLQPGATHGLRAVILRERARSMATGNLHSAAEVNAKLSQEALLRTQALHKTWLKLRDPSTKLYAQSAEEPVWSYRNTAADFFSFHLMAGLMVNPPALESLKETLAAEGALRTAEGLCTPVMARTGQRVEVDRDELLFGSSEYAKDGLLSVYERLGGELVGERLIQIVDAIMAQSSHSSRFGALPGQGAEINGNLLQLCGRLSYAKNRADYGEFAARIADAMIQQSMAKNNGLPPKFYDYSKDQVVDGTLKLKDHGNEAVLGLAEAYAMAVDRRGEAAWKERAGRWAEPVARMFEIILEKGTNADGLLVATMQSSPPGPSAEKLCDNWGYILSGAILFVESARRHGAIDAKRLGGIEQRVDGIARAVFRRPAGLRWSGDMDSEADAVESALYMAAYRPVLRKEAMEWADRQIVRMFEHQKADGSAVSGYLDGNFMRTSMLYSEAQSGGWRVEPWREDVFVGLAVGENGDAVLKVWSTQPYEGVIRPARTRHRSIMNLPWNWARLNSWPEWYPVTSDLRVTSVSGIQCGEKPSAWGEGLAIKLPAYGSASIGFGRGGAAARAR